MIINHLESYTQSFSHQEAPVWLPTRIHIKNQRYGGPAARTQSVLLGTKAERIKKIYMEKTASSLLLKQVCTKKKCLKSH